MKAAFYFVVYCSVLLPAHAGGQLVLTTLTGVVNFKGGGTCPYKVVFTGNGNEVSGYSITTMEDGTDLKATVKGALNRTAHTLSFIESDMQAGNLSYACLFDVKLTYKLVKDKYLFTGTFVGHDLFNIYCDEGTVTFELPYGSSNLLNEDHPRPAAIKKVPKPKKDTVAAEVVNEQPGTGSIKVTAQDSKQFSWASDTCVLEIWDGMVIDGDIVTIVFNGHAVLHHYLLVAAKKRLVLPLAAGSNTLTITAENEGSAPPNTSQVLLTDGKKSYGLLVCLKEGQHGTMTLLRHK